MMTRLTLWLIGLVVCVTATSARAREIHPLDFDWRFIQSDIAGAEKPDFDDSGWQTLDLPHDWSIEGEYRRDNPDRGAGAYLPGGVGWYRRVLDVPPQWQA